MHFSIDRAVHTTAFDKPVADHWLERKIAQTAAGSTEKDRSDLTLESIHYFYLRKYGLTVTDEYEWYHQLQNMTNLKKISNNNIKKNPNNKKQNKTKNKQTTTPPKKYTIK